MSERSLEPCSCQHHYRGVEKVDNGFIGYGVEIVQGIRIHTDDCPVHGLPACNEDRYAFETPAVAIQSQHR